jgi:hypothetical protein
MTNPRNGSYAIIPCYILDDENIEEGAKNLYSRISMLSEEGRCWASNEYFAEKHKVTTRCIQNWLKQLADAEYIQIDIDKTGFQTKRDIWIVNDFKKQFTKRTTVRVDTKHSSSPHEPQCTSSIYTNNNLDKEQQQQKHSSGCSSDSEKVKELAKFPLSSSTVERVLAYSLDEIKVAIECCLNPTESIKCLDAYIISALKGKWQPKPSKEKIAKQQEDTQQQQTQNRQKLYLEAKQLELTHNLKFTDTFKFSVTETDIKLKIGNGYSPLPLNETSIKYLKDYINKHRK